MLKLADLQVSELRVGDQVQVQWGRSLHGSKECFQKGGIVKQITPRLMVIENPHGYCFCVSLNDMATGTIVNKRGSVAA